MNKYAIVNLQGGLGNQIFQIAYALHLKSLNIKTYVDTHFYSSNMMFPRKLELDIKDYGLSIINFKNNTIFDRFNVLFREIESFSINDLKKFNRFVGYYQDFDILNQFKETFQNTFDLEKESYDKNLVAVHIRRGDYLQLDQVLTKKYYNSAYERLLMDKNNYYFDIFTDEVDIDKIRGYFKNVNNIFQPTKEESPLKTFKKLSMYQNYILANSSFSAIAAFLSRCENKQIFYPSPWWRMSDITISNIPEKWIPIINHK